MITEEVDLKDLFDRLSSWVVQIRLVNSVLLYDANKMAETFAMKLLNLLYGLQLEDLNDETANMPGLDLGDTTAEVAFQVSTSATTDKVISTLRTVIDKGYDKTYSNGIRFLILSDGVKIAFKKIKPTSLLPSFDEATDIIYLEDLCKRIKHIYETDTILFEKIKQLIHKELILPSTPKEFENIDLSAVISLMAKQIQNIKEAGDFQLQVQKGVSFDVDASVPSLLPISKRDKLVEECLIELTKNNLVWINGGVGTGKTSLAVLVAQQFSESAFWFDLNAYDVASFVTQLITDLSSVLSVNRQATLAKTIQVIAASFPEKSILILNHLPDIAGNSAVQNNLINLLDELHKAGVSIFITSSYLPGVKLKQQFLNRIYIKPIPPLSSEETKELLSFYEAPAKFLEDESDLVKNITQGHALIVNFAALYLKEHDWNLTDEVFMNIFKSNYGQDYTGEVYAKILQLTHVDSTKDLLYRIKNIIGPFTDKEIEVVGNASPAIFNVHERSQKLKGTWLQETENGTFQLSPLIKSLGSNGPEELIRSINLQLGDLVLSNKVLSPHDAKKALNYYFIANEYTKLAWLLLTILEESMKSPDLFFKWGFDLYWADTALPEQMPTFYKVLIRIFQLHIIMVNKNDVEYLTNDLEVLLGEEDLGDIPKSGGFLQLSNIYLRKDPVKSLNYFIKSRESLKVLIFETNSDDLEPIEVDQFIWTSFYSLETPAQFEAWFANFKEVYTKLDIDHLDEVPGYVVAGSSLNRFTDLSTTRTVEESIEILELILEYALAFKLDLLAIYSIKYLIHLYSANLKDIGTAKNLLEMHKPLYAKKQNYKYLLFEEYGRQLYFKGDRPLALKVLLEIVDHDLPEVYIDGMEGPRLASYLLGSEDKDKADVLITKASNRSKDPLHPDILRIQMRGEVAISLWLNNKSKEALFVLADAYNLLLQKFDDSPEHRAAVIRICHVVKYIADELMLGTPPALTGQGDEYTVPERGFFFLNNDKLSEPGVYFDERNFVGTRLFVDLFEFLEDYDNARVWAMHSVATGLNIESPKFFPLLYEALPYLIIDREYIKSINLYSQIQLLVKAKNDEIALAERHDEDRQAYKNLADSAESFFYHQIMLPITITISHGLTTHKISKSDVQQIMSDISTTLKDEIKHEATWPFILQVFENALYNRLDFQTFQHFLATYSGQFKPAVIVIGNLLYSVDADAKESANLHLPLFKEFELYKKLAPIFYKFELIPFVELFWIEKMETFKQQVESIQFWRSKSLPRFTAAKLDGKLRNLAQALVHHLNVTTTANFDHWMDN